MGRRRLTKDEVIQQFREVHGNDYDYSKFVYRGSYVKGIIICPNHGEFLQQPIDHKKGQGCPRCSIEKRTLSQDKVIQQFREVHGNDYDYSKFVYVGTAVKGTIICPNHGEFEQSPRMHKQGNGCPRCAHNHILSQDEVIQQFREVHGNDYDYSKFVYVNSRTKGIIICPIHGEFEQTPDSHKRGRGCPHCKGEKISKGLTLSQDKVIQQFREVHGNFYDYSKFVYRGDGVKGIIICPIHGEFIQLPDNHKRGQGCSRCRIENLTLPQDKVIQQFREVHIDLYDYSKFVYVNSKTKGIVICPHHGEFEQTPDSHKRGRGCPRCANESKKGGYDNLSREQRTKIKDVYLYHIELKHDETIFHKVGITGDPPVRFSDIQRESNSVILNGWTYMYLNAEIAFQKEQKILDHMMFSRSEKYYHPIKFNGMNECFLPVPNPQGWNLDLNNIPPKSPRFNYNDAFE